MIFQNQTLANNTRWPKQSPFLISPCSQLAGHDGVYISLLPIETLSYASIDRQRDKPKPYQRLPKGPPKPKIRSDTIQLWNQVERPTLKLGDSDTSLELTKQLRQLRIFLRREELRKSQTTLGSLIIPRSEDWCFFYCVHAHCTKWKGTVSDR